MADHSKLQGIVNIKVHENVTLENLNHIIATVGGLVGCRTCGILGIDLRLTGDPAETHQLANLPGVKSVTFGS